MSATAASRNALRTGTILLVFACVGTAILAFTHQSTEPTITPRAVSATARSEANSRACRLWAAAVIPTAVSGLPGCSLMAT